MMGAGERPADWGRVCRSLPSPWLIQPYVRASMPDPYQQPDKRPKSPMSGEPLRAKDLIPLSLMADPEWTVGKPGRQAGTRMDTQRCLGPGSARLGHFVPFPCVLASIMHACTLSCRPIDPDPLTRTRPPPRLPHHNDATGRARRAGQVPVRRLAQAHHHAARRAHQEVSILLPTDRGLDRLGSVPAQ